MNERLFRRYIDEQNGRLVTEIVRPGKFGFLVDVHLMDLNLADTTSSENHDKQGLPEPTR